MKFTVKNFLEILKILLKIRIINIFGYIYLIKLFLNYLNYYKNRFNIKNLPFIKGKVETEKIKIIKSIKEDLDKEIKETDKFGKIPQIGFTKTRIIDIFKNDYKLKSFDFKNGKVSGAMYSKNTEHDELLDKIHKYYLKSNPLHTNLFPSIRKMENELISFMIDLFNGDENTCGTFTSGGTESILLACKTYRDYGYSKGIYNPEIIVSSSVHCAFNKAAKYFKIKLVTIPCVSDGTYDLAKLVKSINKNTILIVGSTPSYNLGVIDQINELNKIALKYKINLHLDACIGSFLINFTELKYDFSLKGVTSISADFHKYGQAPKGASSILYKNKELLSYQYFLDVNWSGGIYATSNISGSRCGNIVALTWATMMFFGKTGYQNNFNKINEMRKHFINKINEIKELYIIGDPKLSIIAITSKKININLLCDEIKKRKWSINVIQNPNGFHFCLTSYHTIDILNDFFIDLNNIINDLKDKPYEKFSPCIYGTIQKVNNTGIIEDVVIDYLHLVNNVNLI